jgi:RNA polymerase sigma factor FliA
MNTPTSSCALATIDTPEIPSLKELIEGHLHLVRTAVDRIKQRLPSHIEADDLYSAGLTGLVIAARNLQDSKSRTFCSYAITRIRGAILDELRKQDFLSRGGRTKARRYNLAISKLEQEFDGPPDDASLCKELNLTAQQLAKLEDDVRPINILSLDGIEEDGDGEIKSLYDIVGDDDTISGLDALARKETVTLLAERMAQLPDVQKKVLALSYYEEMKLSDIAVLFKVTESRICQIRSEAVNTLRAYLTSVLA